MNRREQARQKKRKERERRLARARHVAQSRPEAPDDEDGILAGEPVAAGDAAPAGGADGDEPAERWLDERLLRRLVRAAARLGDTGEDLERATAALQGKSIAQIDAEHGDDPVERAQDLAFRAWDAATAEDAAGLAQQALRLDPACIDARAVLALQEPRERVRLERLQQVADDAARALGGDEPLLRPGGLPWMDVRTRPCLRALHARLQALARAGRTDDVIAEGRALLELDAGDHLRASHELCGALLERGELPAVRALLDRQQGEGQLTLAWARILERFLSGERREAATLVRIARLVVPQVEDLLAGRHAAPTADDTLGQVLERVASETLEPLARAWTRHREARRWLADGALASTAAERRAAPGRYGPPVSALLRLGEPVFGGPGPDLSRWPDYVGEHGFALEHAVDLLHMADDPALHEQDPDDPAVWAPVHAWRTLGLMAFRGLPEAGAGLAALLLHRVYLDPDEDWTCEDAVHVLGLVGAPAFDDTAQRLRDRTLPVGVRGTAAGALAQIGQRHAALRGKAIAALAAAVREIVDDGESARREDPEADPADALEPGEADVVGLAVCGLMTLHAGRREAGPAVLHLVEQAIALGLADERLCGPRAAVLAELRGAEPDAEREQRAGEA